MTTNGRIKRLREGISNYRRMLAYVRPYWRQLALAAISLIVISLLGLAMPWAVQNLVDLVVVGQDFSQLNRIAPDPGRHLCAARCLWFCPDLPHRLGGRAGGRQPAARDL